MKKIVIFSVAYHPFIGGAEVAVKEITDRIHDCEFDMITLNLDGKQRLQEKIGNVNIYRIGGPGRLHKLLYPFAAYYLAGRLHTQKKYDATWSIMASFSGFAALFFKYIHPQVPFILSIQEGDPISYIKRQVWFIYPVFKQIFRRANVITALSAYLAQFAKDMGARVEPLVVPNGVDMTLFSETFPDSVLDEIRKEIGKEKGDRMLITTSRLVEKNGIEDLIGSLIYLPHSVKLVIIGTGDLERRLRSEVEKNKLSGRIIFLGQREYKDIPKYLKVSDVFIRPSLSEGMGNSFIEAMAARIPVIATPVGGIPDFLRDHETGLFCEPHDPQSIAHAVEEILANPELKAKLVAGAHTEIRGKYEWNTIAEKMQKIFAEA